MEPEEMTLVAVMAFGTIYNMYLFNKERRRPKRIAVIEDSDSDFMLFKFFFHLDNVIIDRYKTADNLPYEFAKRRPDCVIADFYLEGKINGDKVVQLCDKLKIPATLITGYEGLIDGMDSDRIIIKSAERAYFDRLQAWTANCIKRI